MKIISHVTIGLLNIPERGYTQQVTRMQLRDKDAIDKAAYNLGMSTAAFVRVTTVRAAEEVLRQLTEEETPEVAERVEEPKSEPKPRNARYSLTRSLPPGVKS